MSSSSSSSSSLHKQTLALVVFAAVTCCRCSLAFVTHTQTTSSRLRRTSPWSSSHSSFLSAERRNNQQQQQQEQKQRLQQRRRLDVASATAAQNSSLHRLQMSAADSTEQQQHDMTQTSSSLNESGSYVAGPSGVSRFNDPPPFQVTLDGADSYSYRDAIIRTMGWVGAALIFGSGVWSVVGSEVGEEFFAGYLVEQSLSVDNLFVFLLLFEYFKVPLAYQDRVLNWGIYGAIVMRAVMIGLGAAALHEFHGLLLVFAGILIYGSAKFFIAEIFGGDDDEEEDPGQNSIVKFSRNLIDSTNEFDGDRFFTLVDGVKKATPLFICMIAVEISDVVFAVDSIPAVFGVTENPLVVFSSNMFAIMGLRSLYTILSKAAADLKYLEPAVALVLGFIGSKMVAEFFGFLIPTEIALTVVATLLTSGVGLSVLEKKKAAALNGEE